MPIRVAHDSAEAELGVPALAQGLPESGSPSDFALYCDNAEGDGTTRVRLKPESLAAPGSDRDDPEYDPVDIDWLLESPIELGWRDSDLDAHKNHEMRAEPRHALEPSDTAPQPVVDAGPKTVQGSLRPSAPTVAAQEAFIALLASVDPWGRLSASAEASSRNRNAEANLASLDAPDGALSSSARAIQPVLFSDAPVIRDVNAAPRHRSARGHIGLGLSVALVGGIALMVHDELRAPDAKEHVSPAAAALNTTVPMMPEVRGQPSDAAQFGAPVFEPIAVESAPLEPAAAELVMEDAKETQLQTPAHHPGDTLEAVSSQPQRTQAAFDTEVAESVLASTAGRASSCRQAGDPTGLAMATITFAPSGRVTTATISAPPFLGTATGSCIASTMRTAQVPAFVGDFMTMSTIVTIR